MPLKPKSQTFFIAAGEHSGELLGSDLYLALSERLPQFSGFGIVGDAMTRSGVDPVAHIDELSVMGISDVLWNIAKLRLLESRIVTLIDRRKPKFAVLIDNPGFHLRLGEQLRLRGIKVYQYVAPKLWAWGENRVPRVKAAFDEILGILPFEEEFFKSRDVPYSYVGSPVKDRIDKVRVTRETLGIAGDRVIVACLPGSRNAEIQLNLPMIQEIASQVIKALPNALFVTPIAGNINEQQFASALGCQAISPWQPANQLIGVPHSLTQGLCLVRGMSLEAMAAADVAVVASGTATLECGLLGTPMIVVYKMSDMSYQLAKKALKIPYVSLVNLLSGRQVVKEFIQEFLTEDAVREVVQLVKNRSYRQDMLTALEEIHDKLEGNAAVRAAHQIALDFPSSTSANGPKAGPLWLA